MADSAGPWPRIKHAVRRMLGASRKVGKRQIGPPMPLDGGVVRTDFSARFAQESPPEVMRFPNSGAVSTPLLKASSNAELSSGSSSTGSNKLREENISPLMPQDDKFGSTYESATADVLEDYLSPSDTNLQRSGSGRSARPVPDGGNKFTSSEQKLHKVGTEKAPNFDGHARKTGWVKRKERASDIDVTYDIVSSLSASSIGSNNSNTANASDVPSRSLIRNQQLDSEAIKSVENDSTTQDSAGNYLLSANRYVSSSGGVRRLGAMHREGNSATTETIVSQAAITAIDVNPHQPPSRPSKPFADTLSQFAERRKKRAPQVSEARLKEYEAAHISSAAAALRDSISLQHSRRPLKIANSEGSSNQYDRTSKRNIPQEVFERAVERKGFDPSDPASVSKLEQKLDEERAPFTRAESLVKQAAERGYDNRGRDRGSV